MIGDLEYITSLGKSHHVIIQFSLTCRTQPKNTAATVYRYDKADYAGMYSYLSDEVLNKYYNTVFTKETTGVQPRFSDHPFTEQMTDISFEENSIEEKLNSLKVNKSPGPDQLHPRLLRDVRNLEVSTTETFHSMHGQRQST